MKKLYPLILLSCGGTGGHVTPAAALAAALNNHPCRVAVVTDPRGYKYKDMFADIPISVLPSGTLTGGILGKIKGAFDLIRGIIFAFFLLHRMRPAVVVGFGGYPSVPAVYAAQWMGIPTIIHEQNAVMGLANKILARGAKLIALSMPGTSNLSPAEQKKSVITGNPVRPEIRAVADKPYPEIQPQGSLRVLIMGGSLGAAVFGRVVPAAMAALPDADKARLHIVQQCRHDDMQSVEDTYTKVGIKADVRVFFDDMAAQWAACHLFIGRSGASTVAEITVVGRPALFVPYPGHKDQQQKKNALPLVKMDGAWIIEESDFTIESLSRCVQDFLLDPNRLARAAQNIKAQNGNQATEKLCVAVFKYT